MTKTVCGISFRGLPDLRGGLAPTGPPWLRDCLQHANFLQILKHSIITPILKNHY